MGATQKIKAKLQRILNICAIDNQEEIAEIEIRKKNITVKLMLSTFLHTYTLTLTNTHMLTHVHNCMCVCVCVCVCVCERVIYIVTDK